MKIPLILIVLMTTSSIFSSSFVSDPWEKEWTLPKKWEKLQQARQEFTTGNLNAAAPKLIALFDQGVLMSIPFLQKIEGIDPDLKTKVMSLKTTSMARDFFSRNNIVLDSEHQALLARYSKKQDPMELYKIALKITESDGVLPHERLSYWYRFAANMGDVDTQFLFSQKLRLGALGFAKNIDAAFEWIDRASKRCDAETERGRDPKNLCSRLSSPGQIYFDIGALFHNGDGTTQNKRLAAEHFLKSANFNFENAAKTFLRVVENSDFSSEYVIEQKKYRKLLNTPKDLYELSVLKVEHPVSTEEYDQGMSELKEIAQNKKHAHMASANFQLGVLLSKAQASGESNRKFKIRHAQATRFLEAAYQNRQHLSLKEKFYLATIMLNVGSVLNKYKNSSFELLEEMHLHGLECPIYLGVCYEHGIGTAQNHQKAIQFYDQGIANGSNDLEALSVALNASGFLYMQQGNYEVAFARFNEGIKHDFRTSYYNLGIMWRDGLGPAANYAKAIDMFLIAAQKGDKDAQYDLAMMYSTIGHFDEACFWYTKSAEQGHLLAKHNRIVLFLEGFRKEEISLDEIRQDLFDNERAGCVESKLTLAMLLCCDNRLSIPVDIARSISLFESLATNQDERVSFIAQLFLARLKKEEISKTPSYEGWGREDVDIVENFKQDRKEIEQVDVENMLRLMKPSKTEKRLLRIGRAQLVAQEPASGNEAERKPFNVPVFTAEQIACLSEFTQRGKKTNVNPRELNGIVSVFQEHGLCKKTTSGYLLQYDDLIFSTHNSHDDSVVIGAIVDLMTFIKSVLQRIQ